MTFVSLRARFAGCALVASMFLLAACTFAGGHGKATDSPRPVSGTSHASAGSSEAKLTERAEAALAAVGSGTLVEAGSERVTDGIHAEPTLTEGKSYRLNLICVGTGSARVKFTPTVGAARTTVTCDESVVQQRITAPKSIRIDADGAKGATGVIAWRIDAL
ncbi:hypothetical protein [Streptomyces adustus]|uniref:hypothetical protein n=1 Tax=Streptomyces adustus TaxID=1609272 RepID=UPI001EE3EAB8|nr:hypothetical protein [Streptomyces adustus]